MKAAIMNWINENNMIKPNDKVICAVSGGVDSVVMLYMLNSIKDELGIEVMAAHFNHCIRGEESDRDQEFVKEYCEKIGVKYYVGSGDVPARAAEYKESIEEAARHMRYEYLENLAENMNAKIATAHHADDNLETILINMIHGAGLNGLAGIPPIRGRIIRPMLAITRDEIVDFASKLGLNHVEDSTNKSDDYLRNRIRHNITPLMRAENPNIAKNMVKTSSMIRDDNEFINSERDKVIKEAIISENEYSCEKLKNCDKVVLSRVVMKLLQKFGVTVSSKYVDDVIKCIKCNKKSYEVHIGNNIIAHKFGDRLYIGKRKTYSKIPSIQLNIDGYTDVIGTEFYITCKTVKNVKEVSKVPTVFHINKDSVKGNLNIRGIIEGDKIKMPGGTKRLSTVLSNAGFSKLERPHCPIISDENGVVAVYGVGIDMKHAVEVSRNSEIYEICIGVK